MEHNKIGFGDLKWYLKVALVFTFIDLAISLFWFIIGFAVEISKIIGG